VASCLKRTEVGDITPLDDSDRRRPVALFCILRASLPSELRTGRLNKTPLISIVDDDNVVRRALESLVMSLGFRACAFPSAEAFLQSAQLAETSCLISDVQMPGISGVQLQNRLADLGLSIPTIFITAYPDDSVRTRVLGSGAVCFLLKPFDPQSLIECLDDALDRPGGNITSD
jgi:FixJ family two-component response regulator